MTEHNDATATPAGHAAGSERAARLTEARAGVMTAINRRVPGMVTLHYEARDIAIPVQGDVALRMMTVFRRQRSDGLSDALDVTGSSALHGWTTISMTGLLAITWDPAPDAEQAVGPGLIDVLDELDARAAAHGQAARSGRPLTEPAAPAADESDAPEGDDHAVRQGDDPVQ